MLKVGAFEAKNTLGSLLDRVQRGEEIIITRHGQPVARLVPNTPIVDERQAEAALWRIRDRANKQSAGFHWDQLKAERDKGRP
jgi:prevent-host-death family protein